MRRWGSAAAALAALLPAACGGGGGPRYGPMPVEFPRPAPAPAPPPARPAPVRASDDGGTSAAASDAPDVKVGLVVGTAAGTVSSPSGLTVEDERGDNLDELPQGQSVAFASDPDGGIVMTVVDAGGSPVGRPRHGLASPVVVRAADGGVVEVRGVPYRGAMLVQRGARGGLTFVNRVDLESYLLGVVPREIGDVDEGDFEAIKAQAVAARTYAMKYMGRRTELGFDVYPNTQDQVYGGAQAERELVSRAVRATAGEVATYGGEPITAYYHSTCAGRTAAIDEVWNVRPVPYLVSVDDVDPRTGEAYDRFSGKYSWTERWSEPRLVQILNRTLADSLRGGRIGHITGMEVTARTRSGRVRTLHIETDAGDFNVGRDRVRWILTPSAGGILNSSLFDVDVRRDGGSVTEIVASGHGWGHGIGMCQMGAVGRARAGQDYRTILQAYYPGIEITRMY